MRILVTGGAGFIGSHLIEQLLREPDIESIRAVDNFSTGNRHNLRPFLSKIDVIEGDLVEENICERAVSGIDVVFHEAAIPSVTRSVEHPAETHRNGAHLTMVLLESARRSGVRRLVFAGSSSSYGETLELPKHEDMPPRPCSPYAATKVACEQYIRAYAKCYAIDTVSLRYFNVFGPRQSASSPYSGVIARFCEAYCRNKPLTIFGDGEQSRDFTYVTNVVQANLLAARYPKPLGGEVMNIGSGRRTTLNELIAHLNEFRGERRKPEYQSERVGDVRHSLASIERAMKILGYRPSISLSEGLAHTLAWYANAAAT